MSLRAPPAGQATSSTSGTASCRQRRSRTSRRSPGSCTSTRCTTARSRSPAPEMQDIVVLGAGIAGLAAAWELKSRGLRPLVLEQQSRAGGVIVTERADGFVIDGGPDSLLSQKLAASELLRDLGLESRL